MLLPLDPATLLHAPAVVRSARSNFSTFNPALLAMPDGASSLCFFRISNAHFCPQADGTPPRDSWRDSVRLQAHIRSFIGVAQLNAHSWLLLGQGLVIRPLGELFRSEGDSCASRIDAGDGALGTFSGPEDPRPFWSPATPHAPWLLASAWSADCRSLRMHLIKMAPPSDGGSSAGADQMASMMGGSPTQLPLIVDGWPTGPYAPPHPSAEPIQKNWLPFVHGQQVYAEYAVEPHVVLRVDAATGQCEPLAGGTNIGYSSHGFVSFAPLARLAAEYGRVSGGASPIHLPAHRVYLGLAHVKASRTNSHLTGTARMPYRHLFYAFEDAPPFAMTAAGEPFVLPEPPRPGGSTVQFAAGMALDATGRQLTISYSVLDCGARLTHMPLTEVLTSIRLLW